MKAVPELSKVIKTRALALLSAKQMKRDPK